MDIKNREVVWPKDLPIFPIANNINLCDHCFHYWNQTDFSQDQDHCRPMYGTNDLYSNLTPDQVTTLKILSKSDIMCPYFEELTLEDVKEVSRWWGNETITRLNKNAKATSILASVKQTIAVVNQNALDWLSHDPSFLHSLSPWAFEDLIARLFEEFGYTVVQTPRRKDGGKDLYVMKKDEFTDNLYIVECKKYTPPKKVGVEIVRAIFGVVKQERVTGGIVVATTYYTEEAKKFADAVKYQLFLRNYQDIFEWCRHNKMKL